MKILLHKSDVELPVTELDAKQCVKAEFTKVMGKNLTTWDIIGLVVLIMFQHVLFQDTQTVFDSQKEAEE